MSVAACALLVQRADPDRFRAAMAAPVAARKVLFPLYAFNAEVSRAPWVTQEPLIAQMRLQWWRDALAEIAAGGPVRRHEVVTPLAGILTAEMARDLDGVISARYWDITKTEFENVDALVAHLDQGPARLMILSARALGCGEDPAIAHFARAASIGAWLAAAPRLRASGCPPAPRTGGFRELADAGQRALEAARAGRARIPASARPALLAGWQTAGILRRARRAPSRIKDESLRPGPAQSSLQLIRQAVTGRF